MAEAKGRERRRWAAREVVAGEGLGPGLVLAEPLSLWGGLDPESGQIIDSRHPALGRQVRGKVLILPAGRGSSSASSILLESVRLGTAPAAIITAEVDGILALGAVVARELYGNGPPLVVLSAADYAAICRYLQDHPGADVRVAAGEVVVEI